MWDGKEGFPVVVSGQRFDGCVKLGLKLPRGRKMDPEEERKESCVQRPGGWTRSFVDAGFIPSVAAAREV